MQQHMMSKEYEKKLKKRALIASPFVFFLMLIIGYHYGYAINYADALFDINLFELSGNSLSVIGFAALSLIMWFNALIIYVLIPVFIIICLGSFISLFYLPLSLRTLSKEINGIRTAIARAS